MQFIYLKNIHKTYNLILNVFPNVMENNFNNTLQYVTIMFKFINLNRCYLLNNINLLFLAQISLVFLFPLGLSLITSIKEYIQ